MKRSRNADRRQARFKRIPLGRPWCEALILDTGEHVLMRPLQASDADALRRSFERLEPDEIRLRFLHPVTELSMDQARRLADVDRRQRFALVITECKPPEQALIGAVARVSLDERGDAEFGIIVGRALSGYGLGRHLMQRLIEWCRKRKIPLLYGLVSSDNDRMLKLARQLGFRRVELNDNLVRIERPLNPRR
ncbi:MAG: GNAT family N-acetyltransferase [Wenzhouxiangellaceae bacterium]